MFQLDLQGKCETCLSKASNAESIRCENCQFYFHAICDSDDGNSHPIAKKTHLSLHKQGSTKANFSWKCDKCLTISEENQAASLKDMMSKLIDRFSALEDRLSQEIKSQVSEEFVRLTNAQSDEFIKLNESVSKNTTPSAPTGVWNDTEKVAAMKSSLMVKADKDGNPVDASKVRKLVRENGIPVIKVVATATGDTFINLPNEESRDKLQPLLQSEDNQVVPLKSKLPAVSLLGVTENLSKEQIKEGICNQNVSVGNLVHDGEEFSVVFTKPPAGKNLYHQVTIRVSPKIRSVITSAGDSLFLSSQVCKVRDSFHIRRCNKCQSFGHYAGRCKEDTPNVCGYCGEGHKSDDCLLKNSAHSTHKCANCQLAGLDPEGHSTFYYKCPAYKIQQDKLKSAIAYDYLN